MIEFPQPLKNLLDESPLQPHIRDYANRAGEILIDNQLPFFPDYTDHGHRHINQVLAAEVDLIPKAIWGDGILGDADAAVLIGATLLHDIAMHLRPAGFLELVGENRRFQPLPWFKDEHQGHPADRPWRELWLDFQREAKRFSDRNLGAIIGLDSVRGGWKFESLPADPGQWHHNHNLVIGEFIRRHHARLAHEIAIYGFPGLEAGAGVGQFPALGEPRHPLQTLADLIGLAARSHGMSLRVCQAYLDHRYPRQPQPMGSAVLYPMALLRVADYLQIDRQRTPPALLKLRNPQSPVSVREWAKHLAVRHIGPASDPRGKMVTVSPDISQAVYLQLRDLLAGLQQEMDHATAVLDEAYGLRADLGLDRLKLATRRIHSNLDDPAFRDSLPFVPERTGYSTDPNLLTLLVEPLYGKEPGVGVRELMQNAVDAVCELHAWCEAHGVAVESLDLPKQDADVQIDFIDEKGDGNWILRVTDKGIGMTADTIQNYFLRAGASFRQSPEWAKEFVDDEGKLKVLRAGRFGIGAFAVFLLGPRFRLWTRHVGASRALGYFVEAEGDSRLIELRRVERDVVGSTIEIDISVKSAHALELDKKEHTDWTWRGRRTDWFCWDWPLVNRRIIRGGDSKTLPQEYIAALRKSTYHPEWLAVYPLGFDVIYWTFFDYPRVICDGLKISSPRHMFDSSFNWPRETQLKPPSISIFDSKSNLSLDAQRYELSDKSLPFVDELDRDITFSVIAHALVHGPKSRTEAHEYKKPSTVHPLVKDMDDESGQDAFLCTLLRWCSSFSAIVLADQWLYSLLQTDACIVFGSGFDSRPRTDWQRDVFSLLKDNNTLATLCWDGMFWGQTEQDREDNLEIMSLNFSQLVMDGFCFVEKHNVNLRSLIFSCSKYGLYDTVVPHLKNQSDQRLSWHGLLFEGFKWKIFEFQIGIAKSQFPFECFIEKIKIQHGEESPDYFFYIAEIKTKSTNPQPETLLAKIWNECLGPNPIPFDPEARRALIERGRQHPELKRHIEAWEEMKHTGSKWVFGD